MVWSPPTQPIKVRNYIDGEFVDVESYIDSPNPATGSVNALVPDSGPDDAKRAIAAAKRAFKSWSCTPVAQRAKLLNRIADEIEANLEDFAKAESQDQGKPVWLARAVDIPRAVYNFRFFAGAVLYHEERTTLIDDHNAINRVERHPMGVAGLITPWNLPLYLLTWKIAPALATGNTVVAKPSEFTSVTAFMLAELMDRVGVPKGVCNFVFGTGPRVGQELVTHPDVPLVSFTGGTATGQIISMQAAPLHKKLSLELGGKNPSIIFPDVDLDAIVPDIVRSSFTNQGEICLCMSRIYVHEDIYDRFLDKFVAATRDLKVGPPDLEDSRLGALVSKQHLEKVRSYVDAARREGATVLCGEGVDELDLPDENKDGFFMRPTVLADLEDCSVCVREEIFGPVVSVLKFKTTDEVIERANDSSYGLAACVWARDGALAQSTARQLHAGTVWINCWMLRDLRMPFGGVKGSGTGRESAKDSIDFFTDAKTVCYKL